MKLDSTSLIILKTITSTNKMSVIDISKELNMNKGSIYPRLEKINYWLKLHNLNELIPGDNSGLYVHGSERNRVIELIKDIDSEYILQPHERVDNIIIYLVSSTKKIDISHLSELNGVSRNTTLNDIKKVALNSYGFHIKYDKKIGYQVIGNESLIRNLSFEVIQRNLHSKIKFIQNTLESNMSLSLGFNKLYLISDNNCDIHGMV
ncbi:helix-turn-helix domain-containing protein [Vibrio rumoiensis]|uniref:helix-turn-helix domain-containing protein n=1 Tax=Vibrio rumoiensis TaxID=76258 RepID=UPI000D78A82E|nr:helix-turn-helix domain-containing protein [Vibrio rumoiensis]